MGVSETGVLHYFALLLHVLRACSAVVMTANVAVGTNFSVEINLEKALHAVNERYLSVALDAGLVRQKWGTFNFT